MHFRVVKILMLHLICLYFTGNAGKFDMVQANCGCGKCNFQSLISSGCPKPRTCREIPFMYLDTASLNQNEKDALLLHLNEDADAIFDLWGNFLHQFSSWMKRNVSLEDYKEILLNLPGIKSARKEVHMFNDRKQEIMAAKNHLECFAILSEYHSWFNHSIVQRVINAASLRTLNDSSENLSSSFKSYKEKLFKYCKRNIFECPVPSCMQFTKSATFLVMKVTEEQDDDMISAEKISAEKINLFKADLMKHFGIEIHDYVLNLCTVSIGCVELVYSIPLCIYNELFPFNEDQSKSLAMLGVVEAITKDYHYKKDHVSEDTCTHGYFIMCTNKMINNIDTLLYPRRH